MAGRAGAHSGTGMRTSTMRRERALGKADSVVDRISGVMNDSSLKVRIFSRLASENSACLGTR